MDFWDDFFHTNALQAAIIALVEDKIHDAQYVKRMAYEFYEEDRLCGKK